MYLFVYGTLRRGVNNRVARLLTCVARYRGGGRVAGRLYRISHYPGLVHDDGRGWVRGDVYEIGHPAPTFRMLDAYEGYTAPHEFKRTMAAVTLDSDERIETAIYVYTRSINGRKRIVSGDFLNPRLRRRVR